MKRWMMVVLTASLLLAAPMAFAEQAAPSKDTRAKVEQREKQLRSRVLRKDVGLDDKKAAAVEKVLDNFAPKRAKLQRDVQAQRRALRELLAKDSGDQAAYEKALKSMRASQAKLTSLREKEIDELAKLLTPKEQAKLVVSIRKLQRQIRSRMRARGP